MHTITRTKTPTSLVLQVDGLAPRTRTVSTGIDRSIEEIVPGDPLPYDEAVRRALEDTPER